MVWLVLSCLAAILITAAVARRGSQYAIVIATSAVAAVVALMTGASIGICIALVALALLIFATWQLRSHI